MRKLLPALALATASVIIVAPNRAHADTYSIVTVASDNWYAIGLNSSGTAVFADYTQPCSGFGSGPCFATFQDGKWASDSSTLPGVSFDNGSACNPSLPSGFSVSNAVCNGGRVAIEGAFTPAKGDMSFFGVFTGSDPFADRLQGANGNSDALLMDSAGDILFTDGSIGLDYEAFDLSSRTSVTPEPAGLALLSTGLLGAVSFLRRRLF